MGLGLGLNIIISAELNFARKSLSIKNTKLFNINVFPLNEEAKYLEWNSERISYCFVSKVI